MSGLVFVYGTLKEGFPNFSVNRGRRVAGQFVTIESYPLYIIGPIQVPWLVDRPGTGYPVIGELYQVDEETLAAMDLLEQVDEPGWYQRRPIQVTRHPAVTGAEAVSAFVYFGDPGRVDDRAGSRASTDCFGPFPEYTLQQSRSYRDGGFRTGD